MDTKQEQLPHDFANYFIDKIVRNMGDILDSIENWAINEITEEPHAMQYTLSEFTPATEEEILVLVSNLSNSDCDLDPISTTIF